MVVVIVQGAIVGCQWSIVDRRVSKVCVGRGMGRIGNCLMAASVQWHVLEEIDIISCNRPNPGKTRGSAVHKGPGGQVNGHWNWCSGAGCTCRME